MIAAISILPSQGSIWASRRSSGRPIEISPPCPASSAIIRLRIAAIRAASSSERPPATWAAAISPCEWPTTAAGSTPQARQSRASETITEKMIGCTMSTRCSQSASSLAQDLVASTSR